MKTVYRAIRLNFERGNLGKLKAVAKSHGLSMSSFLSKIINAYLDSIPEVKENKNGN